MRNKILVTGFLAAAVALADIPFAGLAFMVLLFSWIVREVLEALLAPAIDHVPLLQPYKWVQIYIAIGLSIGLAFFFSLDIVYIVAGYISLDWGNFATVTWVGTTITGCIIGMGANFVHKLFEFLVEQWDWLKKLLGRSNE